MRKRAEWMTRADDEILEFLDSEGGGTPKMIADGIGKTNNYVGERCRKLTELGLLERPSRGFYRLTIEGEQYLAGELDASDLESAEK
ncbi:helix-turn-helix domain-containing protein [Natronobacterium texcoconense]|uniref:Winged helix-turn-helix DNA-binding n=1 Tax=Natronobacterium texcoconense TaxID=1095778 RepID=A0A1H1CF91_NATTX|nr:hypothetical protein [Natronobacterium texcoconense]SDQ62356.1 hypothetical protein SAMN04489842_1370 [Natronobacterium texcoconense]